VDLYRSKTGITYLGLGNINIWTESRLQQLARLKKSGKIYEQIADILGGADRNNIVHVFHNQRQFRSTDLFKRKFELTVEKLDSERQIFCESCGGKVSKSAKFCSNCGEMVVLAEVEAKSVSKTSSRLEKRGPSEDENLSLDDDRSSITGDDYIENISVGKIAITTSAAHRAERKEDNTSHLAAASLKHNAVDDDKKFGFFDFVETGQAIWGAICLLLVGASALGLWFGTMAPSPENAVVTTAAVEQRLADAEAERLEAQNQLTRVDTDEEVLAFEAAKSSKRITNLGEFYVNYPDSKNRNKAKQLATASLHRQNSDLAREAFVKYFGALPVTQTIQNELVPEPESPKIKLSPELQNDFAKFRKLNAEITEALSKNKDKKDEGKIYKEISYTGPKDFDGEPHGIGKMVFQEGVVYEGQFEHGKRVKGETRFPDGSSYTGGYLGAEPHGVGIQINANGNEYKGTFENGKYHGQGIYTFVSGDVYNGIFKNGKFNGQGVYTFVDGTVQSGEYRNGDLNGQGREMTSDGISYIGGYKDGVPHGHGVLIEPNGKRYEGGFVNGRKNGQGLTVFEDGASYKGQCKAGVADGEGVYDGPEFDVIIHGTFNEGELESYTCQDRSGGSTYACEGNTLTLPC